MSIQYGLLYGACLALFYGFGSRSGGLNLAVLIAKVIGGLTMAFFVVYRVTFAYFWNRRATRIEQQRQRRPAEPERLWVDDS